MNEKFGQLLKNIDLTSTQIKIYLSVLKNGLSTVLDISKDTKINRSQIYFDTSILVERGILELAAKRKRKFLAIQPNKIAKIIKEKNEKLEELESVLADASIYYESKNKNKGNSDIKIFEGIKNVKKFFDFELDDMNKEEGIYLIGNVAHQTGYLSQEYWSKWNSDFSKKGNSARMLLNSLDNSFEKYKRNDKKYNLETRGIPNLNLKAGFDIWRDNVFILSYEKNMLGVYIKNQLVADTFRELFNHVWKRSE